MFSSASSAEWTSMGETGSGTHYLDLDRIRKNGGYVYVWQLENLLKPRSGIMSTKVYSEVDCKAFRRRGLTYIYYKQPMGEGDGETHSSSNSKWIYPPPGSMGETILSGVCSQ